MIPASTHYWLTNAHVPISLLVAPVAVQGDFAHVDLEITDGYITQVVSTGTVAINDLPSLDLRRGQVWPCFVDMHTHLDKGHIWERSPNTTGTFTEALDAVRADSKLYWDAEDVYRRMQFGLKCSYAHGTQAIRTHIDSMGEQAAISFSVFKALQREWSDRLTLQAVCLVPIDYFQTAEGEKLADLVADVGGVLGGLAVMNENLDAQLNHVLTLAHERQLPLDFHVDENGDPESTVLRQVAAAILRQQFDQQVICGHCCSLAVQPADIAQETINLVKQAGIGIVSLPMCNLFLQDRNQEASSFWLSTLATESSTHTPRWRGVTLLHELDQADIPVAVASDNCRDPFYGFGDHDMLEVFTQATRIAHLDVDRAHWCRVVTQTPAQLLGLPQMGQITVGSPADLVLFKARSFSELLSRPQSDRIVLRRGQAIDTTLPDYAELDDLISR
jgi:cytosine deaminase